MAQTTSETLIKRYGGTRLYNTETAAYVTLDDLAKLRIVGRRFRVREASTGKDITREILSRPKRKGCPWAACHVARQAIAPQLTIEGSFSD